MTLAFIYLKSQLRVGIYPRKGVTTMRLSTVLGIRRRRIRNRIFTIGFIVTGMLSLAFGVVTFYGQNAGNFIMSVDPSASVRGISIAEEPRSTTQNIRLMSNPIEEARPVTYSWLKIDEVMETSGNFVDPDHEYIAYTFYLRNSGDETVDLSYYIRITDAYKDVASAIRILIIQDGVQTMYMRQDLIETTYPGTLPTVKYFQPSQQIIREVIYNFRMGQEISFSVIIWLEGYDLDTNDELQGGMIRMFMNFSIITNKK
jgi:hypothetical protein